jgi:hypothetical protein
MSLLKIVRFSFDPNQILSLSWQVPGSLSGEDKLSAKGSQFISIWLSVRASQLMNSEGGQMLESGLGVSLCTCISGTGICGCTYKYDLSYTLFDIL